MGRAKTGTGPDDLGLTADDLIAMGERQLARKRAEKAKIIEAPPADIQRPPTEEERAEAIAQMQERLDHRYDKEGNPVGLKRTLNNLDHIIKRDPYFRRQLTYNGLAETVEWNKKRLRDEDVTRLRLEIARTYKVQFGAEDTQAVLTESARMLTIHPVVRYLSGLKWDGEPRIDTFLSSYLGVEDSPLVRSISRRWFVSCVARAYGKGEKPVKVDTVLILAGDQGAQKSTCFRVLAGEDWFSDTALDLRSKDAYQAIRGVWIYELAELAATRPRDAETVKAFLSAPTDRYRPPYGRNVVESHRQCVFVGTTNEATFLSDPTGARRFWPVTVGVIDIAAIGRDRDMLWAEAAQAYREGEVWWLDRQEDRVLAEAQEQYQHDDPWAVFLDAWFTDSVNKATARSGMRVGEVLSVVLEMDKDKQGKHHEMRMGGVLQGLGWEKKRARRGSRQLRLWFPPDAG